MTAKTEREATGPGLAGLGEELFGAFFKPRDITDAELRRAALEFLEAGTAAMHAIAAAAHAAQQREVQR